MKKLLSAMLVIAMIVSLCPAVFVLADETDIYARQVTNIPYYSNGQIKFRQTSFGNIFTFDGESNYDLSGEKTDDHRLKRLTATNQNEIWRLMMEPAYLFTGWNLNATAEQYANGEIYAQLDLGGSTPIDEIQVSYVTASNIKNNQNYSIDKVPKIYRFDVSDDGKNYTTVKTVTTDLSEYKDTITTKEEYVEAVSNNAALYDLMCIHKVIFDSTVNARYIRFVMIQPTQDWVWKDGSGDRSTLIGDYQLFTYNTWKDIENESETSIAVKDSNGIYQFSNNGKDRNIIGFTKEEGLSSKAASRVTYKDETISRDWNLDEGALQSSNGNFALISNDYSNYANENVYLQYDFGYPERIDVIEQNFRNTEDTAKVNDIPKLIRIDYGNKNARGITEWTKGELFTIDMSSAESVGQKKASAYNNYLANGTSTNAEKLYLNQPVKLELEHPVTARYMRIVYLQPTQDGSQPTSNKLKIKKTTITNLAGLADSNTLATGSEVPFNDDGSVIFINTSDDNISYSGETNETHPVSRIKASSYISGKDWFYRHIITRNTNSWTGLKASPANFANEKISLDFDFGANINVDSLLIDFATYRDGSTNAYDRFMQKYQYYNSVPAKVRIDYGIFDDSGKIAWTEGKSFDYALENYDELTAVTEAEAKTVINTAEADRTQQQQRIYEIVDAVPTTQTYELGYKEVRFLRYVLIDPIQSGIENNSASEYCWYLHSSIVYGSKAEKPVTSATITAATENSIEYTVTLSEEDKEAVIFAAIYKDNALVAVKRVTSDSTSVTFDKGGADTATIFVWDGLARIKPLAKAETTIQ